jgi:hypothetical protein
MKPQFPLKSTADTHPRAILLVSHRTELNDLVLPPGSSMSQLLEPPIELRGELSKADVLTADRMLTPKKKRVIAAAAALVLSALIVAVGVSVRQADEKVSDRVFLVGSIVIAFMLVWRVAVPRYRIHRAWATRSGIFDVSDTTISNDGVLMKVPHATHRAEWPLFFAAMTRPTAVILFYPGAWMLFARSRFSSEHDWNRFTAFVQQRFEIVHSQ